MDVPEGQTAHFHTVGVYEMFSRPNSIPHRPSTWRCIELGGTAQAARFCQRVAANLQTENPRVTRRLNTSLLVENGARKQTLRFAVCEPWSVCDPSVSFLSATICP